MFLTDLLFRLPPKVFVRIRFVGEMDTFCFTTGKRNTGQNVVKLVEQGKGSVKVNQIIPLWHAEELYIECS